MNRWILLAASLLVSQSALAQYYYYPSPYQPGARHAPYGWYHSPPYAGGQWSNFDGGLYGSYGGYQPYAIRPYGGSNYANPSYMGPSYSLGPNFSLDSGVYSLGALKNLPSLRSVRRKHTGGEIKITHSAAATQNLHFALNGEVLTIKPGETQQFVDDRDRVIAFGSGGTKGDLRYTLKTATYRFVATKDGWDLKQIVQKEAKPPDNPSP